MTTKIVAIAGGTASGKTTLAELVTAKLGSNIAQRIAVDFYYRCNAGLTPEQRTLVNFDHPDSLEFELLARHLKLLSEGESVELPQYDFSTHTRKAETKPCAPSKILVIEGILALHPPELRQFYDHQIFVDAPSELRLRRRIERDVRERGRTRDSVLVQWSTTVEPMYAQYCLPSREYADMVVDGAGNIGNAVAAVMNAAGQ